jgi:hypothetical protein
MAVRIQKPAINIREKLSELDRPVGITGDALLATNTPQEAFSLIGAGRVNRVINGDMQINQRGGTISVDTSGAPNYSIDRFAGARGSSGVAFTLQQSSDAPSGFKNSLLVTVPTGSIPTSNQVSTVVHGIEGFNTSDFDWGTSSAKTVTVSFWVKSNVTGIFPFIISNNGRTRAYGATYSINTASTWEYKTITIPGDTTGTWETTTSAGIFMYWGLGADGSARTVSLGWSTTSSPGSSLGTIVGTTHLVATTGATLQLTGVQLEEGKVATPFDFVHYQQKLALCQRYFVRYGGEVSAEVVTTSGLGASSTVALFNAILPVQMRAIPSVSFSQINLADNVNPAVAVTVLTVESSLASTKIMSFSATVSSGIAANRPLYARTANTSGFLAYSSEF